MITFLIPVVQESDALIFGHGLQKPAYFYITVDFHLLGKERMGKCEVRIILTGVFFFYDQIGNQIQNEPGIIAKPLLQQ